MLGRIRWTKANARHIAHMVRQARNPAATVYDSLGPDFFLAPAPGWLNLGLWDGAGGEAEAPVAVRRLVEAIARELPAGATILDVGNGLGRQDVVIAHVARPQRLIALNITESQLRAGRAWMREAHAAPVIGDATRLPVRAHSVDGIISVEAAFHFSSRRAFFDEVMRVLTPGGTLTMSDISAERTPRGPHEWLAGATTLRFWGLRRANVISADEIAGLAAQAGLVDIRVTRCGERVVDPAIALFRERLESATHAPRSLVLAARTMLDQWSLLRRRGLMEYLLLRASVP